jgi:hypothetical protein
MFSLQSEMAVALMDLFNSRVDSSKQNGFMTKVTDDINLYLEWEKDKSNKTLYHFYVSFTSGKFGIKGRERIQTWNIERRTIKSLNFAIQNLNRTQAELTVDNWANVLTNGIFNKEDK